MALALRRSMSTVVALAVILLSAFTATPARAKNFLASAPITTDAAEKVLNMEFHATGIGGNDFARTKALEAALYPIYRALPKNSLGRVEHNVVRYVLHRLFVKQHGWHIKGLEPAGDTWGTLPTKTSVVAAAKQGEDWVPSFLQDHLEPMRNDQGLDLPSLVTLAESLEDLVLQEATTRLIEVYEVLQLPTAANISKADARKAVDTYMMVYLVARKVNISSPQEAQLKWMRFTSRYRGFSEMRDWLTNLEHESLTGDGTIDFESVKTVIRDVGEGFATFNEPECGDLRSTLFKLEDRSMKAGRVRLADFYNMTLYSHWNFNEKIDYLRELGVLDETNSTQPMVIVPNYVTAPNNCLKATNLYSVCCRDLCEDLMAGLESELASPTAPPERIAKLVSGLTTATVTTPRELSSSLLQRLQQLASASSSGEVHLHGRLFAQWMHHAFPRECPYPHVAGTTRPQTAEEWLERTGQSASSSEEEMRKIVEDSCSATEEQEHELPWSHTEELLAGGSGAILQQRRGARLRSFLFLTLVALGFVMLDNSLTEQRELRRKYRLVATLCLFIVVVYAAGMLDYVAFFLPLAYTAIYTLLQWQVRPTVETVEKVCP